MAYATEEILRVLTIGGVAALSLVTPIGAVIAGVMIVVVFSYRQTIHAYPSGGGAYIVAKDNLGRMPSDVELVLFRVIQEALTNIWRHSGSRTARIQLSRQVFDGRPQITLSIEDDGKGIPNNVRLSTLSRSDGKQHAPSGLGLIGMRERLHQIGGQLEIHSMTGKTVIRAVVRLNQGIEQQG